MARCAVVATALLPNDESGARALERWIVHHLDVVGFNHAFVFYDAAELPIGFRLRERFTRDRLTLRCRSPSMQDAVESVPLRQMQNAQVALQLARARGIEWLLHIDIDELFVVLKMDHDSFNNIDPNINIANRRPGCHPSVTAAQGLFERCNEKRVDHITFANHEGIPEQLQCPDLFSAVTLFRRNHLTLGERAMSAAVGRGIDTMRSRTTYSQYMLCYDNGKAAVRVAAATGVSNVHAFETAPGSVSMSCFLDVRSRHTVTVFRDEEMQFEPCVLHFTNCGLDWLVFKYRTLGDFAPFWVGNKHRIPPCFHLECKRAWIEDGVRGLEKVYRRQVAMMEDMNTTKRELVGARLCFRVDAVQCQPDMLSRIGSADMLSRIGSAGTSIDCVLAAALCDSAGKGATGISSSSSSSSSNSNNNKDNDGPVQGLNKAMLLAHIEQTWLN